MAIGGSLRGTAGMYAACAWAVVQIDLDGGDETWYGVGGATPTELEVQRTIKRAEIWALYMASCNLVGPTHIS